MGVHGDCRRCEASSTTIGYLIKGTDIKKRAEDKEDIQDGF